MSEFVQAYDPDHRVYRKIEVKSGNFVDHQSHPFDGLDEVDGLESKKKARPQQYDPLWGFR